MRCSSANPCGFKTGRSVVLLAGALPLALAACAQSPSYTHRSDAGLAAPSAALAMSVPPRLDATGGERKPVPGLRRGRGIDDPREPFSPNYGPPARDNRKPVEIVRQAVLSDAEANAIIARAVAAHELRNQ